MIQKDFADKVINTVKTDPGITGIAAAGSWITNEIDEFSDLDLIIITTDKISGDKEKMLGYASKFGTLLTGFTGEHVGEPRVLICLYDNPLLHVDLKFLTLQEFRQRVENPVVLFERDNNLSNIINSTEVKWPYPDYQWIEDRFWVWVHYVALKLGRGEYFESLDSLSFLRTVVLSPLMQIKKGNLPRGLRKVETSLGQQDIEKLKSTVARYDPSSIFNALENVISIYKDLRKDLFTPKVKLRSDAEEKSLQYLNQLLRASQNNDSSQ